MVTSHTSPPPGSLRCCWGTPTITVTTVAGAVNVSSYQLYQTEGSQPKSPYTLQTICQLRDPEPSHSAVSGGGLSRFPTHFSVIFVRSIDTNPGLQLLSPNSKRRRWVWASKKNIPLCSPREGPCLDPQKTLPGPRWGSLSFLNQRLWPEGGSFQLRPACLNHHGSGGRATNTGVGQLEPPLELQPMP